MCRFAKYLKFDLGINKGLEYKAQNKLRLILQETQEMCFNSVSVVIIPLALYLDSNPLPYQSNPQCFLGELS